VELEGTFREGVIVPDDASALTEGERVRISPADWARPSTFGERYAEFKGCLVDLPEDFAALHDHYRLGTPKR
jgi:hypothetical protein